MNENLKERLGTIDLIGIKKLPQKWAAKPLGDLCQIRRGASPRPAGDPKYFGGNIPWFKIGDATKTFGKFINKTEEFVNVNGAKKSVLIPAGSLIVANSGVSLGFAVFTEVEGCIHDGWLAIEKFDGIDKFYTYYLINLLTKRLRDFATGTTQPNLNTSIARSLLVPVPPIEEQRAIAEFLGILDEKIEINNKINRTLEQMAQILFKSWFVDFDPVVAKAEGKNPFGIREEIAAYFPSKFKDTESGAIPDGWRIYPVGEAVKTVGGGTPSTKEPTYWESGSIYWATPRDLANLTEPILIRTGRKITEKGLSKISSGLLPKGTVLLSSRAPIGYIAISDMQLAINQGFIAVICNEHISRYYMKHWLEENLNEIISRANGTTFLEISKRNFRPIPICIPSDKLMKIYHDMADRFYQPIISNIYETQTLIQLRNTLLPKLISGRVKIRQTEKILPEAF